MVKLAQFAADGAVLPLEPEWRTSGQMVDYESAVAEMEDHVANMRQGSARERIWLLEHPPLITAGTSAQRDDLRDPDRFPVYRSGRGGQLTYHGPGQRVVYVMLDLNRRGRDIRAFVHQLEQWIIVALARLGVAGERRQGRIGIWVETRGRDGGLSEAKIAALGIRVRRWISYHGLAINLAPDLTHYEAIVPCGVEEFGITSLAALGVKAEMEDLDRALRASFFDVFAT